LSFACYVLTGEGGVGKTGKRNTIR